MCAHVHVWDEVSCVCKLGGSGGMLPQEIFFLIDLLRLLLTQSVTKILAIILESNLM